MQTLSHGVLKPEDGDTGAVFFPALENNAQILNDHTHDGTDSERLSALAGEALLDSPTITWVDTGDGSGTYRTDVSMPAGLTFDATNIAIRSSAGVLLYLAANKLTATTFRVYSNDNSLDFDVVYTT